MGKKNVVLLVFSEKREGMGKEWGSQSCLGINSGEEKSMEAC